MPRLLGRRHRLVSSVPIIEPNWPLRPLDWGRHELRFHTSRLLAPGHYVPTDKIKSESRNYRIVVPAFARGTAQSITRESKLLAGGSPGGVDASWRIRAR